MKYVLSVALFFSVACKDPGKEEHPMPGNPAVKKEISYLALGDSYTIGESVSTEENFPNQLSAKLSADPGINLKQTRIVARTGWTTQNLTDALNTAGIKDTFGLVTLLIGVNNQYQGRDTQEYAPQFENLLERAIAYAGGKRERVYVISIPDYGYTPFGAGNKENISKGVANFNAINKSISGRFGIGYFNITPISQSSESELTANDGLHPSAKQYRLWVELMSDVIQKNLLVP